MPDEQPSGRDQRDLVSLADGSLEGRRRDRAEARVAASLPLWEALGRQRAGVVALRTLETTQAPLRLRQRIESERSSPSRRGRGGRFAIGGAIAGAMAAVALAAVLVLPSSGGEPSVVKTAQLSTLPSTDPPAAPDPSDPRLLTASAEGLPYPNLIPEFGWRPAGQRSDEIEGREATTVFYQRGGKRIGYTVVSGDALDAPEGAVEKTLNDVDLRATSDGSQRIVSWQRGGHTCVMAAEGVSQKELLTLASWKGDGAVPF